MKKFFTAACLSLAAVVAAPGADANQIKQWQSAAEQGDASAMSQLARAYTFGDGVIKDYVKAYELYRKAADKGVADAQNGMGFYHYSGLGGAKKDFAEAMAWYRKAAEQGLAKSQCNLAMMLQSGEGVPVNLTEAVKWLQLSAEQGFANAQYLLAIALRDGSGTAKSAVEAWKWFSLAAAQKYGNSAQQLAQLETSMLPEQLAAARKLAAEFKPKTASAK
jgi:TPR repeat protein